MQWLKTKWKFIAGLFGALVVLWLSTRATRHNNKRAQHEQAINALDEQSEYFTLEVLKHSTKAANHIEKANSIKAKAEQKIKKIKEADNETINQLVDRWNTAT